MCLLPPPHGRLKARVPRLHRPETAVTRPFTVVGICAFFICGTATFTAAQQGAGLEGTAPISARLQSPFKEMNPSLAVMPLPDFTDCKFTASEPDVDWLATIHLGGPARALNRRMPAFGNALSDEEIQGIVDYVRGFCTVRAWPHGNLNPPRSLVTDKAFPEDEAFVSAAVPTRYTDRVETRFVYATDRRP